MLCGMILATVVAALLGVVAARSIVAVSDTHRLELPDRWYGPTCVECGTDLDLTLVACRASHHRQRRSNFIVLLVSLILSGLVVLAIASLWLLPAYLVFLWTMILLTVTDLDTKLIPNRMLGPATVIGTVLLVAGHFMATRTGSLVDAAIGGVAYFAAMFLLALVARGGLGFGDVKLAFLIGIFVGYIGLGHVLLTGVSAFLIGGFVAGLLLVTRIRGRKDAIPFGPFMTTAAVLTAFFGTDFIAWYLR